MLDTVEPIVVPRRLDDEADTTVCPGCASIFSPLRSNQRYCGRPCQQRASRNASRGSRSTENRVRTWQHYERVSRLTEMLYSAPAFERLGVMRHILEFIPDDAGLRNILTDPELHMEPPRADNRMNIAKAANAYTQKIFGMSIRSYVKAIKAGQEPEGIPLR